MKVAVSLVVALLWRALSGMKDSAGILRHRPPFPFDALVGVVRRFMGSALIVDHLLVPMVDCLFPLWVRLM